MVLEFHDTSNSCLKNYIINNITSPCYGFLNLWRIASALDKSTDTTVSLLVFDKRPYSKRDLKTLLPFLKKMLATSSNSDILLSSRLLELSLNQNTHSSSLLSTLFVLYPNSVHLQTFPNPKRFLGFVQLVVPYSHLAVSLNSILIVSPAFEFRLANFSHVIPLNDDLTCLPTSPLFDISFPYHEFYTLPPLDCLPPELAIGSSALKSFDPNVCNVWQLGVIVTRLLPKLLNISQFNSLAVQIEGLGETKNNPMGFNQFVSRLSAIGQITKNLKNSGSSSQNNLLFDFLSSCFERDYRKRISLDHLQGMDLFQQHTINVVSNLYSACYTHDENLMNSNIFDLFKIVPDLEPVFLSRSVTYLLTLLMNTFGYDSSGVAKKKAKKGKLHDLEGRKLSSHTQTLVSIILQVSEFITLQNFAENLFPSIIPLIVELAKDDVSGQLDSDFKNLFELLCGHGSLLFDSCHHYKSSILPDLFLPFLFKSLTCSNVGLIKQAVQQLPKFFEYLPPASIKNDLLPKILHLIGSDKVPVDSRSACLLMLPKFQNLEQRVIIEHVFPVLVKVTTDVSVFKHSHFCTSLIVVFAQIIKIFKIDPSLIGTMVLPVLFPVFTSAKLSPKQFTACSNVIKGLFESVIEFKMSIPPSPLLGLSSTPVKSDGNQAVRSRLISSEVKECPLELDSGNDNEKNSKDLFHCETNSGSLLTMDLDDFLS
ncbi:hypothetical protein GEMRC1_008935 [Eukaryota sp. GEM-RC1]